MNPDTVKILGVLNPLASCLVKNEDFKAVEVAGILRQIRSFSRRC